MSDYEYIRRDKVLLKLLDIKIRHDEDGYAMAYWSDVVDKITAISAEDVEPVRHGRAIYKDDGNWYCETCGKQIPDDHEFCNHCGVKIGW